MHSIADFVVVVAVTVAGGGNALMVFAAFAVESHFLVLVLAVVDGFVVVSEHMLKAWC